MASAGKRRTGVIFAALLVLGGCQSAKPAAEPVVAAAPPKPVKLAQKARPKRVETPCKTAAQLTAERKVALFRQFAALQANATDAAPATLVAAPPAPASGTSAPAAVACRNGAG